MKTFSAIAERYISQRVITPVYAANVRRIASRCGTVSVDRVNAFLRSRIDQVAGTTVRSERTILLTLYKFGYESGLIKIAPRGVMSVKARRSPTKAWTVEQLKAAVAATRAKDAIRLRSGASLGVLLRAWMLLGYECGSRFGDLWSMTKDNIDGDAISWTQSKTGDPIVRSLTPACLDAVDAMLAKSPDGRILGWVCRKRQAMRLMREHLDQCGIGGSSKWLRRSGATHIEINEPGKAKLHLGHRPPGLAETNYLDWTQIRKNAPRTPALV